MTAFPEELEGEPCRIRKHLLLNGICYALHAWLEPELFHQKPVVPQITRDQAVRGGDLS